MPFSCKQRGLCPSCGTRRMCDEAATVTDRRLEIMLGVGEAGRITLVSGAPPARGRLRIVRIDPHAVTHTRVAPGLGKKEKS